MPGFVPTPSGRVPGGCIPAPNHLCKSAVQRSKRTVEYFSRPENQQAKLARDRFIEGLLLGKTRIDAAAYAGFKPRLSKRGDRASRMGWTLANEPYVQERFKELREAMEEDQLLSRKEFLLNVKSIAFNEEDDSRARIQASALLARTMGFEAAQKIDANVNNVGGVMCVPVSGTMDDWERTSRAAQEKLKEEVKK